MIRLDIGTMDRIIEKHHASNKFRNKVSIICFQSLHKSYPSNAFYKKNTSSLLFSLSQQTSLNERHRSVKLGDIIKYIPKRKFPFIPSLPLYSSSRNESIERDL